MTVEVRIESESGTSNHPARVLVYENNQLVAEVLGKIEKRQGADGGWYPCIILKKE